MYWDIKKPLSYGKAFNFIVGMFGCGKTFGAKEFVINNFLKRGSEFVYIRRYKAEISQNNLKTFFDDVRKEKFPNEDFKVKNREFFINEKYAGMAIALSTGVTKKSVVFDNVTDIIFDEFILEKGTYHYLQNEVETFLRLYSSIARDRRVRVWFLSNAVTVSNPYFIYFKLRLPFGKTLLVLVNSFYYKNMKMKNTRSIQDPPHLARL